MGITLKMNHFYMFSDYICKKLQGKNLHYKNLFEK
jgi:hypothetical protein